MLLSQAFGDRHFILPRADALRRIAMIRRAKQDALRSFSKGGPPIYYVYLIESLSAARDRYVGITSNLEQRLREHNAGKSSHTQNSSHGSCPLTSRLLIEPKQKLSS